jgi:cbb3-type cytochrome c oxidase subunit III
VLLLLSAAALLLSGCRQDMHDQPKMRPLRASDFYSDMRSARPLVEGTVPAGEFIDDTPYYTGKVDGNDVADFPLPVDRALLERGQQRYDIYCAPCHSSIGDGNGMIPSRGLRRPPSFHTTRLRQMPVGHFFDVITNGFGAMSDYRAQVPVRDRWAIIAYIRVLQLSQNASATDLPADKQPLLDVPPEQQKTTTGTEVHK